MNSSFINKIGYAVFLIFIQIIFLNNINIIGLFNPKITPIFILLFSRRIQIIYFLLIALIYGFIVDAFSLTYGINMFCMVFIAFNRKMILKLFYNKSSDEEPVLSIENQGRNLIFRYLFFTMFLYHLVYFFMELGQFNNLFYIVLKSVLSSSLALFIYVMFTMLFSNRNSKKDFNLK